MTDITASGTGPALLRSSSTMAAGTILSRLTGFARSYVIVAAVGTGLLGDAYATAFTIPTVLYFLLIGGALNAVFIPQLVRHMKDDADQGLAYAQRLLTLVTIILVVITIVAVACAPFIMRLYGISDAIPAQYDVAVAFARYTLPGILFYGVFVMFQQVLTSRDSFAAPMFAPILNNIVVIATGIAFLYAVGFPTRAPEPDQITSSEAALLGIGTLLGVIAQTVVLVPSLRRVGFRWRPRFDYRGAGLGRAGNLAAWTFLYVLVNQVSLLVIIRIANTVAADGALSDTAEAGYAAYQNAYLLFILPHGIATVSIATALLPRISRHAADNRLDMLRDDLTAGLRLAAVVLVPSSVFFVLFGIAIGPALYGFANGSSIGALLAVFALGLVPFSSFYILHRAFYAQEDTRAVALLGLAVNVVNVSASLLFSSLLPSVKVLGLALGFALSYTVGLWLSRRVLSRRIGSLRDATTRRTYWRILGASLAAAVLAGSVQIGLLLLLGGGRVQILVATIVAGILYVGTYVIVCRTLDVREVRELTNLIGGRLLRR
ncbi:MAG TPA: murein biosynthesis integral membrane protein MurJ [Actinomycetes bacterium]|nr:murein biosynthesis integral membrane protein MurJ [Actinomycetes bacterium]